MVDYQVNLQSLNIEKHILTVNKILKADNVLSSLNKLDSGGLRARSKEQGLGPCRAGVRGFESHPPHQILQVQKCCFSFDGFDCDVGSCVLDSVYFV
jgi:hypothetical protein